MPQICFNCTSELTDLLNAEARQRPDRSRSALIADVLSEHYHVEGRVYPGGDHTSEKCEECE